METIKLNDLLQLTKEEINKTKIRFMVPSNPTLPSKPETGMEVQDYGCLLNNIALTI